MYKHPLDTIQPKKKGKKVKSDQMKKAKLIASNLVQDHPDAVDFVGFDINRPVKLDFNHGVSLHLQENE